MKHPSKHHLYERATDPEAATVLMVPGLDGTALLFFRQIPRLAQRFNVAAFPLPDDPHCTMETLVEDLRQLIEEVSPGPVVLCGESFGGALGLSFALAHPDRLAGLVILNSFPVFHQPWKLWLAPPALRLVPWAAMPFVRRYTLGHLHSPHASADDLREFHDRSRAIGRRGYIRRIEILRSYDVRERLSELSVPTLFLASDRDRLIPSVREAQWMSARVPDATLRVLEGYGHVCLINEDLDLLEYIGPWFDCVSSRRV